MSRIGLYPKFGWKRKKIQNDFGCVCKLYFYFQDKKLADDIANGIIVSNRSLVLQRVTKKAAGIFTCQATNAEGYSTSNELQLNVKCKLHFFLD